MNKEIVASLGRLARHKADRGYEGAEATALWNQLALECEKYIADLQAPGYPIDTRDTPEHRREARS